MRLMNGKSSPQHVCSTCAPGLSESLSPHDADDTLGVSTHLIVRALRMAAAMSLMFQGFTKIAPAPSDCAAPANSLKMSTPALAAWHATYSYETRFMPSRREVTRATSVMAYSAQSSWKERWRSRWWMGTCVSEP